MYVKIELDVISVADRKNDSIFCVFQKAAF